jgi:hypothetical protein
MICRLVQYEILTVLLLLWWGTLLAAAQYRTALTPTDYQGGVEVELHPSNMTTEAGLDWLVLGTSHLLLQEWREYLPESSLQHFTAIA